MEQKLDKIEIHANEYKGQSDPKYQRKRSQLTNYEDRNLGGSKKVKGPEQLRSQTSAGAYTQRSPGGKFSIQPKPTDADIDFTLESSKLHFDNKMINEDGRAIARQR